VGGEGRKAGKEFGGLSSWEIGNEGEGATSRRRWRSDRPSAPVPVPR
jgi:hypothetical protein